MHSQSLPEAASLLAEVPKSDAVHLLPLETRQLVLERDGKRLIDGIDLTVNAGSLTVVLLVSHK